MPDLKKFETYDNAHFERFKILLIIRTLFVTLLLGVIAFINYKKLPELSFPVLALYGLIIFAYFFNIISAPLIKKFSFRPWFINAELITDAIFVTLLIYVTGGSNSVLSFLYIFLILEGGFINFRIGALTATVLSITLYTLLLSGEFYKSFPYLSLRKDEQAINNTAQLLSILSYNLVGFVSAGILWGILSEQIKKTSRSLKNLEDLTKIVFKKIPSGILTVTADGRISSFNNSAEAITGYSLEEVLGKPLKEFFPDFELTEPQTTRNECKFKKKDGKELILGYSAANLGDEGNVVIFQDLTREKEMQEEVKRSERLAALGKLSAGLAHEMRTIVSSISASAQLLKSAKSDEKEYEKLTRILLGESKRLNEIVTNFLNFSKPERNMSDIFELEEIIGELVDAFEKNNSKHIKFTKELDTQKTKIKGSKEGLRQVFSNLLLNAVEAIPDSGEIKIKSTLSQQNPDMIEITVSDTGCGIPEDVLPHIFEPFFTTKQSGAGLGLATVYRIVEAHRGKITVKSRAGEGTEFKLFFPTAEAN